MAPRSFQRGHISKEECVKKAPRKCGALFLLPPEPRAGTRRSSCEPLGERLGISVFPKAFLALLRAVDPVVPDTLSLVFIDEPVLVPLIPVVEPPLVVCASANVLESAIVVSFVVVLLVA